jgi:hypothetical protein
VTLPLEENQSAPIHGIDVEPEPVLAGDPVDLVQRVDAADRRGAGRGHDAEGDLPFGSGQLDCLPKLLRIHSGMSIRRDRDHRVCPQAE